MANTCDIIPKVKTKDGREVDSILFTNLLASGLKRAAAVEVYAKVHSKAFKQSMGDWKNFPLQYKGTLDINGEPNIADTIPFSFSSSQNEPTLDASARKIEGLSAAFRNAGIDVDVVFDTNLSENANVIGTGKNSATITINPHKVFDDTIPHEFGHIYVDILGYDHPLIQQGISQLQGTPLEAELRKLYPEYGEVKFQKELLTTALGREAAAIFNDPASIARWNHWFSRLVRAVGEFLGIQENVARRLAMEMVQGKLQTGAEGYVSQYRQFQRAKLSDVEDAATDMKVALNATETAYIDKNNIAYERLTDWVDKSFSTLYKNVKMPSYEVVARKAYRNANLDPLKDKIKYKDQDGNYRDYTFDELVLHEKMMQNTRGRIYGNITHAIIQNEIKFDANVQANIDRWLAGKPGESYPINIKDFAWIKDNLREIFRQSGLNTLEDEVNPVDRDVIAPELTIASELLGIATTIDAPVGHKDGTMSIIDWKTGGLFKDSMVANFMAYGRDQAEFVKDTKLNRAKLEVVLRALMVKEIAGDKSAKFRNLKIVHMTKKGAITVENIDVAPFLGMIESYFRDPANGKTNVYRKLVEKGLLDAHSYMGSNRELEEGATPTAPLDRINELGRKADMYRYRLAETTNKEDRAKIEVQLEEVSNELIILKGEEAGVDAKSDSTAPMGIWKRFTTNMYGVSNPKVKAFFAFLLDRKARARAKIKELHDKHDELLKPVLEEYFVKHGMKGAMDKYTRGLVNGLQYKELYDFMWEERADKGDGLYARIITENMIGTGADQYSRAQYEYNKWYRETMATVYKKTVSKTAYREGSYTKTVAGAMGIPEQLAADFMPRYMLNAEEITERYGNLSKEMLDYQIDSVLSDFTEQQYGLNNVQFGIPIKFLGAPEIIESGNHTLSTELAFKNFVTNLVMKDELDDVYSIGKGLITMLDGIERNGVKMYKNDTAFLEDQIYLHVLDTKNPTVWSRKGFHFEYNGKTHQVSVDKILRILKSWVSASAMWVKPIAGSANFVMIATLNLKDAMKGSLAKAMGMEVSQIDFTISDWWKANLDYKDMLKDMALGKKEENKLWNMAKNLDYLPDNYDYAVRKGELLGVKNRLFDQSNLYLFHSIGEEYGNFVLMAAQLRHYKMQDTGKSAWDSYDNKGKFIAGSRNIKDAQGNEITELTPLEVNKLKRVSSRIHGAYRQDERIALELSAVGMWALQFKKYLPNILENLIQAKYNDMSIGNYEKRKGENGEDVYQWVGRINEGRLRVVAKWIIATTHLTDNPQYKWSNLKPEERLQIQELLMSGVMFGMIVGAKNLILGDEDDDDEAEKAIRRRFQRLADDSTQGLYVPDLLNSFQNQTTVLPKLYKTSQAMVQLFVDGTIKGKVTQRGDLVGARTVGNAIPLLTSLREWERYTGITEDASHNR